MSKTMTIELKRDDECLWLYISNGKQHGMFNLGNGMRDGGNETLAVQVLREYIDAHLAEREQTVDVRAIPKVFMDVLAELEKATRKFPTWPTDPLHAVGVFNEEAGELSKAVLQQMYEPHKNQPGDVRKEAQQAAAMALRFLASLDKYDWTPGAQHEQAID